jgi:ferredoxin
MPTVEFLDAGVKVECGKFANLRKVALLQKVEIYKGLARQTNCRGNGLCGECVMEIVEGAQNLSPKTRREKFNLKLRGKPANYRLSCQCEVRGDLVAVTAVALDEEPLVPVQ